MVQDLDDVDRGILHELQTDARGMTDAEMGDTVGVSASTVRNRIDILEEAGVIRGFHPEIDYKEAGFELHLLTVCRAPTARRSELAKEALEISGVVGVREILTGTNNLHIESVAVDSDAADESISGIEALDLEIVSTQIIRTRHVQPFDHFGADVGD